MATPLTANTWKLLLKLSAENLSPEQLAYLMRHELGGIQSLEELTQEQAEEVLKALGSLPKLKELLWQASVDAIEREQSKLEKPLSKVEAIAVTEVIVPAQVDAMAGILLKQANMTLFAVPSDPAEPVNL